jgi:hypothetical protein
MPIGPCLHGLQAGVHRLNKGGLLKWDSIGNLHQSARHDPVHHAHIFGKAAAGGLKSCSNADLLVDRALRERFFAAVVAVTTRDVVKDHAAVSGREALDIFPRRDHDTRGLMAEYARRRMRTSMNFFEVGAADAAGLDAQEYLSGADRRYGHGFYANVVDAAINRSLHDRGQMHLPCSRVFSANLGSGSHTRLGYQRCLRKSVEQRTCESTCRLAAVLLQLPERRPGCGPQSGMQGKRAGAQPALRRDEGIEVR